jgi:hypothetical protein
VDGEEMPFQQVMERLSEWTEEQDQDPHHRVHHSLFPELTHLEGVYLTCTHAMCVHNVVRGIVLRHVAPVPEVKKDNLRTLRRFALALANAIPRPSRGPPSTMSDSRAGSAKARYQRAELEALFHGTSGGALTAFVKADDYSEAKAVAKEPRLIQFRDFKHMAKLAQFLKPLEKSFYGLGTHVQVPGWPTGRLLAKGLNHEARGALIASRMAEVAAGGFTPVALSVDVSSFDSRQQAALIEIEHLVYSQIWGDDPELMCLLEAQVKNRGIVRFGHHKLVYKFEGRRCSGDINTALGNCVLMLLYVISFFRGRGTGCTYPSDRPWYPIDDGDDCLLVIGLADDDVATYAAQLQSWFLGLGMVLKVEGVATIPEHVDFCQSRPVLQDQGWTLVRNPEKVISTSHTGVKWGGSADYRRRRLGATGLCLLAVHFGTPVLQAFALAFLRIGRVGSENDILHLIGEHKWRWVRRRFPSQDLRRSLNLGHISDKTRESFATAFPAWPVERQIAVERFFAGWDPEVSDGAGRESREVSWFLADGRARWPEGYEAI